MYNYETGYDEYEYLVKCAKCGEPCVDQLIMGHKNLCDECDKQEQEQEND